MLKLGRGGCGSSFLIELNGQLSARTRYNNSY